MFLVNCWSSIVVKVFDLNASINILCRPNFADQIIFGGAVFRFCTKKLKPVQLATTTGIIVIGWHIVYLVVKSDPKGKLVFFYKDALLGLF